MKDGFTHPSTPSLAFNSAYQMADEIGLSLYDFCVKAKVPHSPVYRWRDSKTTYNVTAYSKLKACYERELKKLAAPK